MRPHRLEVAFSCFQGIVRSVEKTAGSRHGTIRDQQHETGIVNDIFRFKRSTLWSEQHFERSDNSCHVILLEHGRATWQHEMMLWREPTCSLRYCGKS